MSNRRIAQLANGLPKNRGNLGSSNPLSVSKTAAAEQRERKVASTSAIPDGSASGIQVAIRCRRRSPKEVEDKSPMIVSVGGPENQEVTIEIAASTSAFGVVTLPPTRTYLFDTVFGPEADQASVYQRVVSPMLDEVLQGYNCTLFAYGQTGTGKTYTMQGDLNISPLGNPAVNAGMMPRVLINLFQTLEAAQSDFTVKVSYVELYNEELRDLLSYDNPDTAAQPTGTEMSALKIFDDASKKGVFIQGIEEILVKDARSAIAQLTRGSQRRQVAATKFNDHSSRSHAVFTITVHMKETSNLGDDLLKVGKFNLVDLAGSENVGRSGAENKRAREAGMINQSLLTLGRVINALVDKSSHVPYRESKLTRLLQDSLGGRTKTTIISTVSPAHCNVEETLSTLEYSLRAKSIKNRPEINQRMSRNALLKEYVGEIERLKADLVSAREKNGMYLSNESWEQFSAEKEQLQLESEAAKKRSDVLTSQVNAVREEFEQSMSLLMCKDNELQLTKSTLDSTTLELREREADLNTAQHDLQEEAVLKAAYQKSEASLDAVARSLRHVVEDSLGDLNGIFAKLDRSTADFGNKLHVAKEQSEKAEQVRQQLASQLLQFGESHANALKEVNNSTQQLKCFGSQFLENHNRMVSALQTEMLKITDSIKSEESTDSRGINQLKAFNIQAAQSFQEAFQSSANEMESNCRKTLESIGTVARNNLKAAAKGSYTACLLMKKTIEKISEELDVTLGHSEQQKRINLEATTTEIARIRQQNQRLQASLEAGHAESSVAKDKLIKQVSGLISAFADDRHLKLKELAEYVTLDSQAGEGCLRASSSKFEDASRSLEQNIGTMRAALMTTKEDSDRVEAKINKTLTAGESRLEDDIKTAFDRLKSTAQSEAEQMRRNSEALHKPLTAAYENLDRSKRARLDLGLSLTDYLRDQSTALGEFAVDGIQYVNAQANAVESQCQTIGEALKTNAEYADRKMESLRLAGHTVFEACNQPEPATGHTPRKRVWSHATQWELAGNRNEILARSRKQHTSRKRSREESYQTVKVENDASMPSDILGSPPSVSSFAQLKLIPDDIPEGAVVIRKGGRRPPLHSVTNGGQNR